MLEAEILNDFRSLLAVRGVPARWNGRDLMVLASRERREEQIDLGGFVAAPEMTVRVAQADFSDTLPAQGDRIEVAGDEFRVSRLARHPRSPVLSLILSTADE